MSNHVASEVLKRQLNTLTRKAVMHLLADKASDNGSGIWASKQTMADELCTSKQTILSTIRGLVADGLLKEVGHRRCANGYLVEYCIDVAALKSLPLVKAHQKDQSSSLTGQAALPVKHVDPTGQAPLPHQSSSLTQTIQEPSLNLNPLSPPKTGERKARVRIGSDWQAPAIEALSPAAQGAARQWPRGAYAAQAEAFAKFYSGTGRRGADWEALWAAWVIQKHVSVMRAARAGHSVAVPIAADAARSSEAKPATAAKVREDARSADLHDVLRDQVGDAVWQDWYAPAALLVGDDVLIVAAPTDFHRSWMEDRCGDALRRALDTLGIGVDSVNFQTIAPTKSSKRGRK